MVVAGMGRDSVVGKDLRILVPAAPPNRANRLRPSPAPQFFVAPRHHGPRLNPRIDHKQRRVFESVQLYFDGVSDMYRPS
jgi:hypothetical protein